MQKKTMDFFMETKDEGMETFFISASLCAVQHIMGTWPNSLPSPEASARCVILFLSSSLSLALSCLSFYFLPPGSRHSSVLCSLVVYLASSSGTDCHGRLSQTHALSAPFYSNPSPLPACLPACLVQPSTHKGLTALFWSQSNRKSMKGGFLSLFSERGW